MTHPPLHYDPAGYREVPPIAASGFAGSTELRRDERTVTMAGTGDEVRAVLVAYLEESRDG